MQNGRRDWPVIRVARAEANRLSVRRRQTAPIPSSFRVRSFCAMDSFEMNKSPRRDPGHLPGPGRAQYRRRRDLRARASRPSPATRSRSRKHPAGGGAAGRRAGGRADRGARCAKADVGRGENSAKKCAACHTFDKGGRAAGRPQSVGRGRPAEGLRCRASTIRRRMKAMGGNWTHRGPLPFHRQSEGHGPRHRHDLRRHPARERAGRRHRLSSTPCRTIPRRCRRRPKRRRRRAAIAAVELAVVAAPAVRPRIAARPAASSSTRM